LAGLLAGLVDRIVCAWAHRCARLSRPASAPAQADGLYFPVVLEFAKQLVDVAAAKVLAESSRVAWWSLDSAAAAAFAQRLQRDMPLRARIADAVFDEKAPEILENSHGVGTFPDVGRVVNALRTGNPR